MDLAAGLALDGIFVGTRCLGGLVALIGVPVAGTRALQQNARRLRRCREHSELFATATQF